MTRGPLNTHRDDWRFTQGSRMEIEQKFEVRYKIFLSSPASRSVRTGVTQRPANPALGTQFLAIFDQGISAQIFLEQNCISKCEGTEVFVALQMIGQLAIS